MYSVKVEGVCLNNQLTICIGMLKIFTSGGRSSVGRASVCGTECRQFDPGRSPHFLTKTY